jgi:hypothetical protein
MMMMRQWGISWSFWKLRVQSIAIVELPEETPWQRLLSHRRRQSAPMAVVHILSFSLLLKRNYNSLRHTSMLPSLSLSLSLSRSTPKQLPLILKYFPLRCPWDLFLPRAEIPVLTKEKTHQPVPLPRPHKHTGKNCQSERSKGEEAPNVYISTRSTDYYWCYSQTQRESKTREFPDEYMQGSLLLLLFAINGETWGSLVPICT